MIDPERIWSSPSLPTLPAVAIKLLKLSEDPNADIRQISEVIKTDPAITAKILKSTNSSYFAFRSEVTSIDRAIPLLGPTMVTSLALSFSLVEAAMTSGPLTEHYKSYWRKSVVQAVAAELLGEMTNVKDQYFLAGLLADLGRLAMLKTIGKDYATILDQARDWQRDAAELELESFGFDYFDIGTKLMGRWKLPAPLIAAAEARRRSADELKEPADHQELFHVIAVASAVSEYFCTSNRGPALERMQDLTANFFGMSQEDLEQFLARVKDRMDDAAATFSVDADDLQDPLVLMEMANDHLAQLALREHVASTQAQERQKLAEAKSEKLAQENLELQRQALHDPLTKIYNRHFYEDALAREIHRCQRTADPIAVIFSDIDRFKNLNDTYGHQFGDQVLAEIAEVFQGVLRSSDILARFGGEEFVVLAVQPTEKGLHKVSERIRDRVEAHEIFFEGQRVPVTVSIGAAIAVPRRNDESIGERLVAEADEAMYESKREGRNRVTVRCLMKEEERRLAQLIMQRRFSRWLVNRQVLDIPTASSVLLNCVTERVQIGELACQHNYLNRESVDAVLKEQMASDERFGEAARRLGLLTEAQLGQLLAWQQEDPRVLSQQLVRCGVLNRQDTALLLEQYLADCGPQRDALSEMEIASFT